LKPREKGARSAPILLTEGEGGKKRASSSGPSRKKGKEKERANYLVEERRKMRAETSSPAY